MKHKFHCGIGVPFDACLNVAGGEIVFVGFGLVGLVTVVRVLVDVSQHVADGQAGLGYRSGRVDLKRKETYL